MVPRSTESRDYFTDEGLPRGVVDFHALPDLVEPEKLFHHLDRVDLEGLEEGTKLLNRKTRETVLCCLTDLQKAERIMIMYVDLPIPIFIIISQYMYNAHMQQRTER